MSQGWDDFLPLKTLLVGLLCENLEVIFNNLIFFNFFLYLDQITIMEFII